MKVQAQRKCVMQVAALIERMVPTMAGLAAIPVIVHPIDNAVHTLLNSTLRPYMKNVICDGARGREAGLEICEVDFSSSDETPTGVLPVRNGSRYHGFYHVPDLGRLVLPLPTQLHSVASGFG